MQKVEEEGEIVMVKEHRELDRTGTRKGHIVIKVRRTRLCSFGHDSGDNFRFPHPIFRHNFSEKSSVVKKKKPLYDAWQLY